MIPFSSLPGEPYLTDNGGPCPSCSGHCYGFKPSESGAMHVFCYGCHAQSMMPFTGYDADTTTAKDLSAVHRALNKPRISVHELAEMSPEERRDRRARMHRADDETMHYRSEG